MAGIGKRFSGGYPVVLPAYNSDVDAASAAEDLVAQGGSMYFATTAEAAADIDIASDSAEDDTDKGGGTPGTGAFTLTLEGVDSDGDYQSETVTLNGTADVHPTNDWLFINRAWVATTGTGLVNAGNIQIDDGSGNVMAYIPAGHGVSMQAAFYVPNGYRAWITDQTFLAIRATAATWAIAVVQTRSTSGSWITRGLLFPTNSGAAHFPGPVVECAAGTAIRLRVLSASADDLIMDGHLGLELETA